MSWPPLVNGRICVLVPSQSMCSLGQEGERARVAQMDPDKEGARARCVREGGEEATTAARVGKQTPTVSLNSTVLTKMQRTFHLFPAKKGEFYIILV